MVKVIFEVRVDVLNNFLYNIKRVRVYVYLIELINSVLTRYILRILRDGLRFYLASHIYLFRGRTRRAATRHRSDAAEEHVSPSRRDDHTHEPSWPFLYH